MASKDITSILYDGSVKIDYVDKSHMYFRRFRVNYDLPEGDPKAWGPAVRPRGVTGHIEDTLEKKGLMTWPMGLALQELFGFYNFIGDDGTRKTGFSKGKGTLWDHEANGSVIPVLQQLTDSGALPLIQSASEAWQRRQKKGADIGTIVHDAIEHYVKELPFDLKVTYTETVHAEEYATPEAKEVAIAQIDDDVAQAELALAQFKLWWEKNDPQLLGAEALVYRRPEHLDKPGACFYPDAKGQCRCGEYCGLYDGMIRLDGRLVLCDWKTSNASKSKEAAMPQGVNYTYFIQSAAYALAWKEMTGQLVEDLLIVSARKDGGFDTILASQIGLSVVDCIEWWRAGLICDRLRRHTKNKLLEEVHV